MTITVTLGDCRTVLGKRGGPMFDVCVTDPPYELGFMGRAWDRSGVAFQVETWRAVFDQMKPGAHLFAFSGTRTYHRMAVAIEDAGFEIRDQIAWAYGSGFPKSLDVAKQPGCAEWQGWGTAFKPAWEPICVARKPLIGTVAANVLAHGTGALNIDAGRIDATDKTPAPVGRFAGSSIGATGLGGAINSSADTLGRFPANLVHDGSDEVLAAFPETGAAKAGGRSTGRNFGQEGDDGTAKDRERTGHDDCGGSAARFFYSAKAGPLDRLGSEHTTVKPVDLMRWLVRIATPPGGLILDPFAGSGTTGIAALAEGFSCELIDLVPAHVADIEMKLAHLRGEGARIMERHMKRKADRAPASIGPLFGDI